MLVITNGDVNRGITKDGLILYTNRPAESLNITSPRIYRSYIYYRGFIGIYYYDPSTQMVISYPANKARHIRKYMPAAYIPMMTATTPFFILQGTMMVYMRSFIWTFQYGRLSMKGRALHECMGAIVDFDLPLKVDIRQRGFMIRQASGRYLIYHMLWGKTHIITYHERFRLMQYSSVDAQILVDDNTQAIVIDYPTGTYLVDVGYKEYFIYYGKTIWARDGDRLVQVPMRPYPNAPNCRKDYEVLDC